jgi:hypothetical protein
MKVDIGIEVNLERLIETRLLIQANSGGGKSYAIRKLLEATHGKVQQIVLDLEGEFSSLRERYDFILFGEQGDYPVNIKYAEKTARTLLELNVSAIIDLYELKHHERITFVKRFLDSMINAPKGLWHSCLVVVDEAHIFCPEKGQSEAMGSVIDLMTRGRKRGYCGILATQRLSKLHKDAAAEANNKLIGRTGLDVDMKRAGEELGFTSKQDMLSLRNLYPGEFYAFGPAISNTIESIKIGKVFTSHPKTGARITAVPPASEKVKKALSRIKELPEEAEKELQTIQDYKKEVHSLRGQLVQAKKQQPINSGYAMKYQEIITGLREENKLLKFQLTELKGFQDKIKMAVVILGNHAMYLSTKVVDQIQSKANDIKNVVEDLTNIKPPELKRAKNVRIDVQQLDPIRLSDTEHIKREFVSREELKKKYPIAVIPEIKHNREASIFRNALDKTEGRFFVSENKEIKLREGARRMLAALVQWSPNGMTEGMMRSQAGLKKSGTYSAYKTDLKNAEFFHESNGLFYATRAGIEWLGHDIPSPATTQDVLDVWKPKLRLGARRMLDVLISYNGEYITDEQLLSEAGLSKSGTYSAYKTDLKTANLAIVESGKIAANKETLFL